MDEVGMNGIMYESLWMKLEWMVSCINLYGWSWNDWYHEWISMNKVGLNGIINESVWMRLEWMVSCINFYGWSWNE